MVTPTPLPDACWRVLTNDKRGAWERGEMVSMPAVTVNCGGDRRGVSKFTSCDRPFCRIWTDNCNFFHGAWDGTRLFPGLREKNGYTCHRIIPGGSSCVSTALRRPRLAGSRSCGVVRFPENSPESPSRGLPPGGPILAHDPRRQLLNLQDSGSGPYEYVAQEEGVPPRRLRSLEERVVLSSVRWAAEGLRERAVLAGEQATRRGDFPDNPFGRRAQLGVGSSG